MFWVSILLATQSNKYQETYFKLEKKSGEFTVRNINNTHKIVFFSLKEKGCCCKIIMITQQSFLPLSRNVTELL